MEQHCPACGFVLEAPKPKRKSRPQENRFHALAAAAFHHWPEGHWFHPKNADHLRYWLTVQAEFFDVRVSVRCKSNDPASTEILLTSVIRASADVNLFADLDGDLITIRAAKSTAEPAMDHADFARLCSAVDDVLRAEGFDPEQLLSEASRAA